MNEDINNLTEVTELTDEQLAEQERLRQEQERRERQESQRRLRKQCEEQYTAAVAQYEQLAGLVKEGKLRSDEPVEQTLEAVLALYQGYEAPLLLEIMQLVRYDEGYYHYHAVNVALLSAMAGGMMDLSPPDIERLMELGLVMDFGMLLLSGKLGSGELSAGERVRVHQHMLGTVHVLKNAGIEDELVVEAVLNHHERYNGSGYPRKLSGEAIPQLARIVSVADSFDAAMAPKAYRKQKTLFQVMVEIAYNADGLLDPAIAGLLVDGIAQRLTGCFVILNDRSVGKITKLEQPYAFPEVITLGKRVQTGPEFYPVSLTSYMPVT